MLAYCDLCHLLLITADKNAINCETVELLLLSLKLQSLQLHASDRVAVKLEVCSLLALIHIMQVYVLIITLMPLLFEISTQSSLSKLTTSILISTSVLTVNSFLIASKVNELDTKQSLSVSKMSFTQYPANLSKMLIRGPILSAYTALIK